MDAEVVVKVCVILAVLAVLWVLSDWDRSRRRATRVAQVLRLGEPTLPQPSGPPLEQVAADIRRLRTQIDRVPPGMPVARRRGWFEAYDDALATACRALDLEEHISALPEGTRRDVERERVERMLARAGLQVRPPG